METKKSKHVGRKILYSLVIGMSGLIALLSLAGIIAGWALESRAEQAAITALKFVDSSAGLVRAAINRVDQPLATVETKTADIADASAQLSQNVTDKGLVKVLLPEEKEQQLGAGVDSLRDTFLDVRGTIRGGLDLYRTIDRIPFVDLPKLSGDQMDTIESGVAQVQALKETLRSEIRDVRAGASGAVDKVTTTTGLLSAATAELRDRLAKTNARLAALQVKAVQLQEMVPMVFVTITVVLTLLLAFVTYTQVEVIRLYVARWKMLGHVDESLPAEAQEPPAT